MQVNTTETECAFRILDSLDRLQIINVLAQAGFFLECRLMIEREAADDLVQVWALRRTATWPISLRAGMHPLCW